MPRIDTDAVTISDQKVLKTSEGRNDPAPTTGRGFDSHWDLWDNPTEAKRLGNGPRPFMSHGPLSDASTIDRGQFSVRTRLDGRGN